MPEPAALEHVQAVLGRRGDREEWAIGDLALIGTPRAIPHQCDEILVQTVFRDADPGAGIERLRARFIPFVGEQAKNASGRIDSEDFLQGCDSSPGRKIQIHQRHVGPFLSEGLDSFLTRCGHAGEFHVGLELNQKREAFAEQWIVIHRQDPNLACRHSSDPRKIRWIWIHPKTEAPAPPISGVFCQTRPDT